MKNLNYRQETINKSVKLIPVILFIMLHAFRPITVGLYHDDWLLFNSQILVDPDKYYSFFIKGFEDRPIYGLILYAINEVSHGDPKVLTIISSAFVALTAYSLYCVLIRLVVLSGGNIVAASLGTAAWIACPWGFGYSLWPTGAATLPSIIFFLWSFAYAIDYISKSGKWRLLMSLGLTSLSYLTYQATYFGFLPIVVIVAALHCREKISIKRALLILCCTSAIQVLAILKTALSTSKNLEINYHLLTANILAMLPRAMAAPFRDYWLVPFAISILIAGISVFVVCNQNKELRNRTLIAIAACVSGIALFTVPYSLSGYVMQGLGAFSRTTIGVNIWLALWFTVTIMAPISFGAYKYRRLVVFLSVLLLIAMGVSSAGQTVAWANSWSRQKQILATFPTDAVSRMGPGTVIVIDEPRYLDEVEVFAASWDISSAVYTLPDLKFRARDSHRPLIVPINPDLEMSWDGVSSFQVRPGEIVEAAEVWIYTPESGGLQKHSGSGKINSKLNTKEFTEGKVNE